MYLHAGVEVIGGVLTRLCVVCGHEIAVESESLQASIFGPSPTLVDVQSRGAVCSVAIATAHMRCLPAPIRDWMRANAREDERPEVSPLDVPGLGSASFPGQIRAPKRRGD